LARGAVALHPTDTLPGLTADPRLGVGVAALTRLKGRPDGKPLIGLVAGLDAARRWWAPLPAGWERSLAKLWPGPVTVVWRASAEAPRALVSPDGTIALRSPALAADDAWFLDVLAQVHVPLPSTSVNSAGGQPARTWDEAVGALAELKASAGCEPVETHVPPKVVPSHAAALLEGASAPRPSTVIRIAASDGAPRYELLRAGALSEAAVRAALGAGASA
jgi:tRNA A37 threonylcarbamoyladenosine synthetase subunit TsaC/SUA5/YrdC